ncbi:C45 family autoproteolytic acyltransferase/hydrolase [Cytophagaceae bacterium YF14B1]|uniref:C45 family autoproteolytic acyltransferase/hydrolase n=1 Tax=Xanthocytophaga flava TaxID=3048013 RepID=A0AAE3QYA6_9BACT|nr:C45 family peptidase [Xanthocytophaga flavus]MDJ1485780.1 C45 family autoproteolytic acyltransferase/hydrolase [Xanthocytophaga flavus]
MNKLDIPSEKVKKSKAKRIGILALKILAGFVICLILLLVSLHFISRIDDPILTAQEKQLSYTRTPISGGWASGNNWIRKNDAGLYEMYIEGNAYERGYVNGLLSQELINKQEDFFVETLNKLLPATIYQYFIKYVVGYFNKDLDKYVSEEYKKEIYGVSRFASDKHNYIAPPYQRILNYHGAHDIGHAMQNMNFVGCTSFGIWGDKTEDGSIIIGRNFDFYVGDKFAQDKIVLFVRPDSGYNMMLVTWGGMIGVVSGMNEHGLTVTLNAAPSEIPTGTATPISLVARQVLQYARTTQEAYNIIEKSHVFVSEMLLVGSAQDHKVVSIEKTPTKTSMYQTDASSSRILCTNHFQSNIFKSDSLNINHQKNNPTQKRFERLNELLDNTSKFTYESVAVVLRDQKGLHNTNIGLTNEAAINQLIAHHAIIFMPEQRMVWVSSNPYNLGKFKAYNLTDIFQGNPLDQQKQPITVEAKTIGADPFLTTPSYTNALFYKKIAEQITQKDFVLNSAIEKQFVESNKEYFNTYLLLAIYYQQKEKYTKALKYAQIAQGKYLASEKEKKSIAEVIQKCKEKL